MFMNISNNNNNVIDASLHKFYVILICMLKITNYKNYIGKIKDWPSHIDNQIYYIIMNKDKIILSLLFE
jgi:hypothetical protein